jgi:hypothetical protein
LTRGFGQPLARRSPSPGGEKTGPGLFVVAREHRKLKEDLSQIASAGHGAKVILDRRWEERRPQAQGKLLGIDSPASDSAAIVTFLTWEESSRAAETRPASNPWGIRATSAGRPRSRAAFEAHQPVVGRVLVRLAPRWDGERRVDEAVDGAALVHYELPDVDEFAGKLSDDVHS